MAEFRQQPKGYATKAIHVAQEPEKWTYMPVIPPIVTTTTFKQPAPAEPIVNILIFQQLYLPIRVIHFRQLHDNEKFKNISLPRDKNISIPRRRKKILKNSIEFFFTN